MYQQIMGKIKIRYNSRRILFTLRYTCLYSTRFYRFFILDLLLIIVRLVYSLIIIWLYFTFDGRIETFPHLIVLKLIYLITQRINLYKGRQFSVFLFIIFFMIKIVTKTQMILFIFLLAIASKVLILLVLIQLIYLFLQSLYFAILFVYLLLQQLHLFVESLDLFYISIRFLIDFK